MKPIARINVVLKDGTILDLRPEAFILLWDDKENDSIGVAGELTTHFIQECLIINPIEQFAKQWEERENA